MKRYHHHLLIFGEYEFLRLAKNACVLEKTKFKVNWILPPSRRYSNSGNKDEN